MDCRLATSWRLSFGRSFAKLGSLRETPAERFSFELETALHLLLDPVFATLFDGTVRARCRYVRAMGQTLCFCRGNNAQR